ncbi:TrkH family potassium uptake protein [Candidatus Bathyarchaeota archaeon]|nr:TrkH family potassium uptake protein [Candidatus Bathyarchaeota archaeon]
MSSIKGTSIIGYLGLMFVINGFVILISGTVSVIFNELNIALVFMLTSVTAIILGIVLFRRYPRGEIELKEAMIISASAWAICPLISSIPFMAAAHMSPIDSYFEAMSGLTATGLTMLENVEQCSKGILFFRSLLEWVGGVGVVVLLLGVIMRPGIAAATLYIAEARTDKIKPTVTSTVRTIWWIYILYTVAGTILLFSAGLPLFDAINHSMTSLATGGFSIKNQSIGAYNNLSVESVTISLMIIGSISFVLHYKVLHGNLKEFVKNAEIRFMVIILILSIFLVTLDLYLRGYAAFQALRFSAFQCVSALSGTGFSTIDLTTLSDFSKVILIILMVTGGGYGSTSGAIKLIRMAIIFKSFQWIIRKLIEPKGAIIPMKLCGKVYEEPAIMEAALFAILYASFLLGGSLLLTFLGYPFTSALFEIASAEGNVGLSVGVCTPVMPVAGKIVLIFEMWAGRLEFLPVIVLAGLFFGYSKRWP